MKYAFVFSGGSCGSFVKTIWNYYLYKNNQSSYGYLDVNPNTGDCHSHPLPEHYHSLDDIIELKSKNKKIILITFEEDDLELITKFQYHKFAKQWIFNNIKEVEQLYPKMSGLLDENNLALTEATWTKHLIEGYRSLIPKFSNYEVDYIIDFKTIIGKSNNLNQVIADYLNMAVLPEVDEFIKKYREINKKLYGNS